MDETALTSTSPSQAISDAQTGKQAPEQGARKPDPKVRAPEFERVTESYTPPSSRRESID